MRINFGSTYKEIEQLLKASTRSTKHMDDAAFEASLGSLVSQPIETPSESAQAVAQPKVAPLPQSPMEELKASYRFSDQSLLMPDVPPLAPDETGGVPTEGGGMSVKTPTLLDVRRVTLDPAKLVSIEPLQTPATQAVPAQVEALRTDLSQLQPQAAPLMSLAPAPVKPEPVEAARLETLTEMPPQLGQKELLSRISLASQKVGLDPALAMSVVKAESGFNVRAVSSDGHYSKGLFQLLDTTGKDLLSRADNATRQYDPFDPDLNMELGTSYLRYLHDIFRSPTQLPNSRMTVSAADETSLEQLAVAAFNAGEGRVASAQYRTEQAGKDPAHYDNVAPFLPRSTREYVARVVRGKGLF